MTVGRWSDLDRRRLIDFGKGIVTERLERAGCRVTEAASRTDATFDVRSPSGRGLEVFVSTQRVGGYVFWTKRRLQPAAHRLAAVVLLGDDPDPRLYLVPSLDWLEPSPPLKAPDYVGLKSDPEYGITIGPASLDALRRYAWTDEASCRLLA